MKSLTQMFYIARKDLKIFATDRGALFFFILFPFLFITLFSLMGGGASDPRLQLYLVSREPAGGLSYQIIDALKTTDVSALEPGQPEIIVLDDYDKARRMVADKEIGGFLAFPEDFSEGVYMGYGTQIEVVADAEAINARAALNGLAHAISSEVGAQQVAARSTIGLLVEQGMASGQMADIGPAVAQIFMNGNNNGAGTSLIAFTTDRVGNVESENPSNWALPGYLVMFVFFGAALGAEAIVRERQNNTLERLMTNSVKRSTILGGIFTGTAVKGLIQIILFWGVGILVFKTDMGLSPLAVIIISILMVLVSAAFSLMLATLVRTQRSAGSIAVLASLVMAPLGGCWWPLFILPRWMQSLAKITPHGWATTAFNKLMLFGAGFQAVLPEMLALAAFAVVFAVIAVWRFRTSSV